MYFKLSLRNVKRSIKDYLIYFLTLTFGVCLFYIFNALEAQQVMLEMTASQMEIIQMLSDVMSVVSVFVSVILCFLVLYANNFLIKRRKKELGIYLTLGMQKKTVSKLLLIEALIIDFFALVCGLVVGTFLSQALSILTAQLFEVNLKAFTFIFSPDAALKTMFYFVIIFIFVVCFNTYTITKYELIDLLHADRKNETLKAPKFAISLLLFLLSISSLLVAYYLAFKNGLTNFNIEFLIAIFLGVMGTYLFYVSISNLLIKLIGNCKGLYYKNLNLFILKQVSSKLNSHHISMTLICLMLFLTLGILSTGLSLSKSFTKDLERLTPFDATFSRLDTTDAPPLSTSLKASGFPLDELAESYMDFNLYESPFHYSDFFTEDIMLSYGENFYNFREDTTIHAIKLSDFNKLRMLCNEVPLSLQAHEYVVTSSDMNLWPSIQSILETQPTLTSRTIELVPKFDTPVDLSYETNFFSSNMLTLILPDHLLEHAPISSQHLNLNYKGDKATTEIAFKESFDVLFKTSDEFFIPPITKIESYESSFGLSTIVTYIGIYLGFVFLIASAAILALQQLSEATDHTKRYELLRKIGVSKSELNRSLFTQIAIYFFAPLSLALIHASVGIAIANDVVKHFGQSNIAVSTLYTCLFLLLVYGTYFLATYFGSKHVITQKK